MLIGLSSSVAYMQLELFRVYMRHDSNRMGIDCAQPAESHTYVCSSVCLRLSPTCNLNYLEYICVTIQTAWVLTALRQPNHILIQARVQRFMLDWARNAPNLMMKV